MADKEKEEADKKNYALNTLQDIWKYDKLRLLDLGNTFQVLLSGNNAVPEINEEARALTNFEKLTEDISRPGSHIAVDTVTRVLPEIIAFGFKPIKAGVKAIKGAKTAKKAAKEASKVASKLAGERSSDVAKAFENSKLLRKTDKHQAAKAWIDNLYENEAAMDRIAGRKLSPDEIENIKKALPQAIKEELGAYNKGIDKLRTSGAVDNALSLKKVLKKDLDEVGDVLTGSKPLEGDELQKLKKAYRSTHGDDIHNLRASALAYRSALTGQAPSAEDVLKIDRILDTIGEFDKGRKLLSEDEWRTLAKNISELPEYDLNADMGRIVPELLLKSLPEEKHKGILEGLKDFGKKTKKVVEDISPGKPGKFFLKGQAPDALVNLAKTEWTTDKGLEMKPDYWTLGSEPTPVSDFIASVFNVDFDDPARFNKKDIDTFFEFLEDVGTIEPGIKDKWTARQKVSVMREILSDKDYGPFIKERWKKSKYNKDLTKYYSGE